MKRPASPIGDYLSYYLVVFVDVLGQREWLRQLTTLPSDAASKAAVAKALRETAGFVVALRNSFRGFFESMQRESTFSKSLPDAERRALRRVRKTRLDYRLFSDSIIISVGLMNRDEHCTPMNGVYAALMAACSTSGLALLTRHAVRGGADVGLGIKLDRKETYGPALERAYALESSGASYPRILVGDELLRYLEGVESMEPTSHRGHAARARRGRVGSCSVAMPTVRSCSTFSDRLSTRTQGIAFRCNTSKACSTSRVPSMPDSSKKGGRSWL